MPELKAFGPLVFTAAAAVFPWLLGSQSGQHCSWLEDWDDGVNYVSNPMMVAAWIAGRSGEPTSILASLSQVWNLGSDSGVILGVFEPIALSAKLLFTGAAGFVASLLGDHGNASEEVKEAKDGRLRMPAKWLLWWSIALHVIAALLLQDSIRRFLALLRDPQSSKDALQSPKVASTLSTEPFRTSLPTMIRFNSADKSTAATAETVRSEAWSEAWAAGFVAAAWAAHPLRIEAVGWLSCVPYGLAGCFAIASVRSFLIAHAAFRSGCHRLEAWMSMLACRCWYICSALCKSTALTLPLALIVLDAILGTFSTSFTATIRNPNGSNSKNNKAVASNFLLQFKAAFWCIGRALDLLAFMLAFVWRAREANISHDNDERWNELHKKEYLWAGEKLSTRNVALKAAHALSAYPIATLWPRKLAMIYPVPAGWPNLSMDSNVLQEQLTSEGNISGDDASLTAAALLPAQGSWFEAAYIFIEVTAVIGSFVFGFVFATRAANLMLPGGFTASSLRKKGGNAWTVALGASWAASTALLMPALGFVQHGWPVLRADRYYHLASTVWAFPAAAVLKQLCVRAQFHAGRSSFSSSSSCKIDGISNSSTNGVSCGKQTQKSAARGALFLSAMLVAALGMQSAHARLKWSSSLQLWSRAAFVHPRDTTSYYNLACVLERLGTDLAVAEQRINAASQAASSSASPGSKADATTALAAATEAYELMAAAAGLSIAPTTDRSSSASELLARAEAIFLVATSLGPSYGAAWNNWGQLAERRGDVANAEKGYRTAVTLNPDSHYKAHNNLGQLLHRSKRYDEAGVHYRAAIDILPTYHLALFNLATLLHTTGASIKQPPSDDTSEIDRMGFEAAPASKSTRATTWGSQEEALSLYRASIEVMPRMPEAHYNYAQLLLTLHGADKGPQGTNALATAAEALDASIALRPHHRPAVETLKHVRALQKRRAQST